MLERIHKTEIPNGNLIDAKHINDELDNIIDYINRTTSSITVNPVWKGENISIVYDEIESIHHRTYYSGPLIRLRSGREILIEWRELRALEEGLQNWKCGRVLRR